MKLDDAQLRRSLRLIMVAWFFGAMWMYIVTGATWTRYAKALDMPLFGFGLITAIPAAAVLLQIPTSLWLDRVGGHKLFFLFGGLIHRLAWVAMALVPWILPHQSRWIMLLVFTMVMAIGGQISTIAWYPWMSEIVPTRIRGRFFSKRNQMGQSIGLLVIIGTSLILDWADREGPDLLLRTLSTAIAIAGFLGASDILCFRGIPAPPAPAKHDPVPFMELARRILADRNFLRFSAYMATVTFAMGLIAQFIWLFVFDVLRATNTKANVIMMVIPMLVFMISTPMWGRLLDRFGRKPVMFIAGILFVPGSMAWIFMTVDFWTWPYLVILVSVAAWPGIELGNFNYLLSLNEGETRRHSGIYIAVNSVIIAMASLMAGLCSGAVAEALQNWHGKVLGIALSFHSVLFFVSSLLRLLSLGWLIGIKERKTLGTRATLRYMATDIYSNLQMAAIYPIQLVAKVGRWTYKLGPFGKR